MNTLLMLQIEWLNKIRVGDWTGVGDIWVGDTWVGQLGMIQTNKTLLNTN